MNFNYTCPPMATVASGLVRPFGNAENRGLGGESAVCLVIAPASGRFWDQGKSNGCADHSPSMMCTSPGQVSVIGGGANRTTASSAALRCYWSHSSHPKNI